MSRASAVLAVAVLVGGCALTRESSVDPAQIPDGPLQAIGGSDKPTGPLAEVGRGRSLGYGWRYVAYRTAVGMCVQLEMASVTGSSCGDLSGAEATGFGGVGHNTSSGVPVTVDGTVGDGVAEVWLELAGGERIPATVMSLEPAGLPGSAFVGFAPEGSAVSAIVSVGADGDQLDRMELAP